MVLQGEFVVPAEKAKVWALFQDIHALAQHLPGCKDVQALNEKQYRAKLATQVNKFMTLQFDAEGELLEARDEQHMEAQMTGKPMALAGLFRNTLSVDVEPLGQNNTQVRYVMNASMTGRLASIGELMMKGAIQKNADEFAANIIRHFNGPNAQ